MINILKTIGSYRDVYGPIIYNGECIYDPNKFYDKCKIKLKTLETYITKDETILEIGSNSGYYLTELKAILNSDKEYLGIDNDSLMITLSTY